MARSNRLIEFVLAAGLAGMALVVSPVGIKFITGRTDLTFRVNVISVTFVVFLLALTAAVLAQGRLRRACFHALAWVFPLALLACIELGALVVHLADRVAPLEDTSLLARKGSWPAHMFSDARFYKTPDGVRLYRPWKGNGITLNAVGLRTALPTPKAPGEWRIAVTGGSATFGWRVRDGDTIPAQLQDVLRRAGHANVTVYNFGIEGVTLKNELALLKHFLSTYAIDQVLFYTGGNDAFDAYLHAIKEHAGPWSVDVTAFELTKVAARLQAMWSEPSPRLLQWLDHEALPSALKDNTLRKGIVSADDYCRTTALRCEFALQPMLLARTPRRGPEVRLAQTFRHVYPRLDVLIARMYRDALAAGPAGRISDLSSTFDRNSQPFFLDAIHLNEAGNRIVAERLMPIIATGLP
jgi:lysophospholipase L1-like esterase